VNARYALRLYSDSQIWLVNKNNGGIISNLNGVNEDGEARFHLHEHANTIGGSGNVRFIFDALLP